MVTGLLTSHYAAVLADTFALLTFSTVIRVVKERFFADRFFVAIWALPVLMLVFGAP